MSEDKTNPPAGDDEKTQIVTSPATPAPGAEDDDDQTVFAQPLPDKSDQTPDALQSGDNDPATAPSQAEDSDQTIFSDALVPDETSADDDLTVFSPSIPPTPEPPSEPDAPVTSSIPPAPMPGSSDDDRTVFSQSTDASPKADDIPDTSDSPDDGLPSEDSAPSLAAAPLVLGAGTADEDTTKPPQVSPAPKPQTAAPPAIDPSGANAVPIGTLINNNYEIKELINAGGMGEVFRGENVFTGDAVAIKIVLQSLAHDEKVASLFMREARVLCQLSDQAIVRYYNFVRDADLDRFCLIMEFIEGIALSDHIRDVAPLDLVQAKGLMRKVASGLDRAHQMDVIHRDLSPDNVMLRDGLVENAVLIDFGIAKSTEMAESTLHGQLAGKFKYISPEQLGHFGGEIGPRTDIYGLGLMMAAALRGKPLDMGNSVVEAVNARREIPDLSDIDPDLRPLLAHMLEPDPAQRPARMSDVTALLDNPSAIPAKYGAARPIADTQLSTPSPAPAMAATVPGLSQPPGRAQTTLGFGSDVVDPGSASPFGGTTGLSNPTPPPVDDDGGNTSILRWLLVGLVLAGIGGFVAWQQGLLGEGSSNAVPPTPAVQSDEEQELPPRLKFLAGWSPDACFFATRVSRGADTGKIAAFSDAAARFDGLADAYAEAVNAPTPTVIENLISNEQCPALGLASALRRPAALAPLLTLDSRVMQSGGSIVGRLSDRRARPVWLAYISTAGGVYNLTDRLEEQSDGSATFTIGLLDEEGAGPTPQMLIAITSDSPLIAAAAATDGRSAQSLLPLIEAEIASRDDTQAGMTIQTFELRP